MRTIPVRISDQPPSDRFALFANGPVALFQFDAAAKEWTALEADLSRWLDSYALHSWSNRHLGLQVPTINRNPHYCRLIEVWNLIRTTQTSD